MAFRALVADTRPLRNPYFSRLWYANIVTVIGAQLSVIAVPAQIYALTHSSAYVGLSGAFSLVPLVIFGLYGGALADIYNRRTLLLISTTGLILSTIAMWLQAALHADNIWVILGLLFIQQAFFAINHPTRSAITASIVGKDQIAAASSLNMSVLTLGSIIGPILGGLLIPIMGFAPLYFLDSLFLFATLWAVYKLPSLPPQGKEKKDKEDPSLQRKSTSGFSQDTNQGTKVQPQRPTPRGFSSLLLGFSFLITQPILLMSFGVDLIAMIFGMPRILIPQISSVDFGEAHTGGLMYALLFAAFPLGGFLGTLFSGMITNFTRRGLGVIVAVHIWGLCIMIMGIAISFADGTRGLWAWIAFLAFVAGGAADIFSAVLRTTILQESVSDNMRGRLQGVFIVVVAGGPRIADILHGWLANFWSAGMITFFGGFMVIVLVAILSLLSPSFLRYDSSQLADTSLPDSHK